MYLSHFLERRALLRSLPTHSPQRKLTEYYNALVQRYKSNIQQDLKQQQQTSVAPIQQQHSSNIRTHTAFPQLKRHATKLHPNREHMMYLRTNTTNTRIRAYNSNNNNIYSLSSTLSPSSLSTHRSRVTRQLYTPYTNNRLDTYRDTMIYRINNVYGIEIVNDFIYLFESLSTRNIIRNAQTIIRQYSPAGYDSLSYSQPSRVRFNAVGDV